MLERERESDIYLCLHNPWCALFLSKDHSRAPLCADVTGTVNLSVTNVLEMKFKILSFWNNN